MDIGEVLDDIIAELIESDISAYDFKIIDEIIDTYRKKSEDDK